MTRTILIILSAYLISSCQWSPERDNPYDPNSVGPDPQIPNRSPQIETFQVTTHCYDNISDPVCQYELLCRFSDPDKNISFDQPVPVYLVVDQSLGMLDSLGVMDNDPQRQAYVYFGYKSDLPVGSFWTFEVKVEDDSGAIATEQTDLSELEDRYPSLIYPPGPYYPPTDMVDFQLPHFSWHPSNLEGYYEISLYLRNAFKVWDSTGIAWQDTSIDISFEPEDAGPNPELWYAWFLTKYDTEGNSWTSLPGWFYFKPPPDTLEQPLRKEQYDN